MISFQQYDASKMRQWNDFIRTSKNGFFMFDRNYLDYHADRFTDHSLMAYDEQGKLIAVLPANLSGDEMHSHQGLTFGGFIYGRSMRMPVMLAVFDALRDYASSHGIRKIIYKAIPHFYHKQPAQEDLYALFRSNAQCYRVDVSSTLANNAHKYAFSSSRKSGLKKARGTNLEIRRSDDFEAFFEMVNVVLNSKYAAQATHTADEMALLHSRFPECISLHACYEGHGMVAGIVVYESDMVAHTQYIASNDRGKEVGATDLLLDFLIHDEFSGKQYFDFGISTEQSGGYLNENLIAQKEGAGARATVHQSFEIKVESRA